MRTGPGTLRGGGGTAIGPARHAVEALVGWPAAAALGVAAALVGATVVGLPHALRMLSAMPRVARLGRADDAGGGGELRWPWRC